MSRSRNIKPAFFKNEDLVELGFDVRLLFIGLWTLADREGRLEDRPVKIKMELFPADSVDIDSGLAALHSKGFIKRYQVEGKRYLQINAFAKHQNPHPKEAASVIPDSSLATVVPEEVTEITRQATEIPEPAGLIPSSLIPSSLPPIKAFAQQAERFDEFWAEYPRKKGKAEAEKKWKREKYNAIADQIIADVKQRKTMDWDWIRDGGQYIPYGSTYVNNKGWLDEMKQGPPPAEPKKSAGMQAIEKLQGITNGLAQNGNQHRVIEADIARIGMGPGDGFDRGNFGGMDGSIDP